MSIPAQIATRIEQSAKTGFREAVALAKNELEIAMNEMAFEENQKNRRKMLQAVYDLAGGRTSTIVCLPDLLRQLEINEPEAIDILDYLDDGGLVRSESDQGYIWRLTHPGVIEIESPISSPLTPNPPNVTYNITANQSPFQIGNNNAQHTIISNGGFDKAVVDIVRLIGTSDLHEEDKKDALQAIERVSQLAQKDKSEDTIKRAKDKLDIVKSVIENGKALGEIAGPLLVTLYNYFGLS